MEAGLLIFVGAILILATLRGWRKGFLKMALGMLAVVLAIVFTALFSPTVTRLLRTETPLYDKMTETIGVGLAEMLEGEEEDTKEGQQKALENSSLPNVLKETLLENNNERVYQMLGVDSFLGYVSRYLAGVVVNICGVLLTFALSFAVLRLALLLLGVVQHLPGIHLVNKVGGGILGFLQGLVLIWLFCAVITVFSGTSWGREALGAVQKNTLLSMVYDGCLSLGNVLNVGKAFW
ncbi:CvpA family protein [Hominifimenecus sp. rT4P-3]|uniref:CvpA family protein n=1 Tax=Hominifimenecus sp. rT4P-3 TaxID=3242979 RepID=UPI003DA3D22E